MMFLRTKKYVLLLLVSVLVILWWISLPKTLFDAPLSCVVYDQNGSLIGAKIALDEQWRFPSTQEIPYKFEQSVLLFEDEHFYSHPGVNPVAMAKALGNNLTKKSKRGGSTISQQVIRLSRKNKKRTHFEKCIELVKATRLEARYSKHKILEMYVNYAPFGGNVVGLNAACWRYFGITANELTWGQAATLAVLPNAPSLVFPGKNAALLLAKRDRLLKKLLDKQIINEETYELALLEALPGKPFPLPNEAYHFTNFVCQTSKEKTIISSLNLATQQKTNETVSKHHQSLSQNSINNISVLVIENKTRKVLAYVGNHLDNDTPFGHVDLIQAKRSTGSTLKPFLYARSLQQSEILPRSLLRDIPISIDGYRPKNFNEQFHGLVPANEALSRSLNVPFVHLLQTYGLTTFYDDLQDMKLYQINKDASHYGLTLILGGAEVSLWELTQAYVNFKEIYSNYLTHSSQYYTDEIKALHYNRHPMEYNSELQFSAQSFSASSVFFTLKAMTQVNRPEEFSNFLDFAETNQIAWKTGTSYGFKDAWSIGINDAYTVGVWVGNADTEGRPQLTGVRAAAPVMFDVFKNLPQQSQWLLPPYDDLKEAQVCDFSGEIATNKCPHISNEWIPFQQNINSRCSFHHLMDVDEDEQFRVNRSCYPIDKIKSVSFVELSPVEAYYTQLSKLRLPPPMHPLCTVPETEEIMEFIFPRKGERIILPRGFDETKEEAVFQLAHSKNEEVHWYIDEEYKGTTYEIHELSFLLEPGEYQITVVDSKGNKLMQAVKVE